jgi:hypothetical protein
MGRRKKEIAQLAPENLSDIYAEIKEEGEIINANPQKHKKVLKKEEDTLTESDIEKKCENNKIILGKLNAINEVIKMYPHLKKDKNKILSKVLTPRTSTSTHMEEKGYVLQKVEIEGKIYYRDSYNAIMDDKLNLVGLYNCKNQVYEYMMHN